jgi:hypothetical protein
MLSLVSKNLTTKPLTFRGRISSKPLPDYGSAPKRRPHGPPNGSKYSGRDIRSIRYRRRNDYGGLENINFTVSDSLSRCLALNLTGEGFFVRKTKDFFP